MGHLVRGHDPPELGRRSARPPRATQLIDDLARRRSTLRWPSTRELDGQQRAVLLHRPERPQPGRASTRATTRARASSTSLGLPLPAVVEEESAETEEFYVIDQRRRTPTASPTSTSSSPTAKPTGAIVDADPGRPAAVADPGDRAGLDRHPRELDARSPRPRTRRRCRSAGASTSTSRCSPAPSAEQE